MAGWFGAGNIKCSADYAPSFRREINGEWDDLREGAEVFFQYELNGEYKNIKKKTFVVIKNGEGSSGPSPAKTNKDTGKSGANTGYNPKGAIAGNAWNNALILVGFDLYDKRMNDFAKIIYDINMKIQKENPSFNGPSIGMAITGACNAVAHGKITFEQVESWVMFALGSSISIINGYEGATVQAAPTPVVPVTQQVTPKLPITNTPTQQVTPSVSPQAVLPQNDIDPDDLPF
jgi:hypothetical protein